MSIDIKDLPIHGGDIDWASRRYGIKPEQWVDLSTGINPEAYSIPNIPEQYFQRLPYVQTSFLTAVTNYYGQHSTLAVSGTQAAIQALPKILNTDKNYSILIPEVGYQEHGLQWRESGYLTVAYPSLNYCEQIEAINASLAANEKLHLLIINPNNPSLVKVNVQQLLQWASVLADGAYLIVDEAFIDGENKQSLLYETSLPANIIVLRSFGKFFGLAGIRLGFVFADAAVLAKLKGEIGIWQVNGPAQYIATQALNDKIWQQQARDNLLLQAKVLQQVLAPLLAYSQKQASQKSHSQAQCQNTHQIISQSCLFYSVALPLSDALQIFDILASQGVLTRVVVLNNSKALLRVGTFVVGNKALILRLSLLFEQAVNALT